jgi:hypothetical protein
MAIVTTMRMMVLMGHDPPSHFGERDNSGFGAISE